MDQYSPYGGCPHGLAGRPYCGLCVAEDRKSQDEIDRLTSENTKQTALIDRLRRTINDLEDLVENLRGRIASR